MQCTRCAKTLPEGVRFCLACGFPVNADNGASRDAAPMTSGANRPEAEINTGIPFAQPLANSVGQEGAGGAEAGFVFQEFGGTSTSAGAPAFIPPGGIPGYPGVAPYPFPPVRPGTYPPPVMPMVSAPKPTRRGRSVGCIVLYAFLAIALLFTGLGVAISAIGSHVLGSAGMNYSATKAAAMQLYQQVTSQPPSLQDPLTGASSNLWQTVEQPTYGCTVANDGLHVHIAESAHFMYCLNIANFFANVAFQIQMQVLTGDAGGLVFRASTDNAGQSLYYFRVYPNGNYALYLDTDTDTAQTSRLASGTTQAMNPQPQQANTLTVIARGRVFDLYINQQFVVQVQDATLATGGIGVFAEDNTTATDVLYNNARIWDLDK